MGPGIFTSPLGHAYLSLGRARLAANDRAHAGEALRAAVDHLQASVGPDHPDTLAARQLLAETNSRQ